MFCFLFFSTQTNQSTHLYFQCGHICIITDYKRDENKRAENKERQSGLAVRQVEDLGVSIQTDINSESEAERGRRVTMDGKFFLNK